MEWTGPNDPFEKDAMELSNLTMKPLSSKTGPGMKKGKSISSTPVDPESEGTPFGKQLKHD